MPAERQVRPSTPRSDKLSLHPFCWESRIRVALARDTSGAYVAHSTGSQSSGVLLSMAQADGLLVIPASSSGLSAGEHATVQLLDGSVYQQESDMEDKQ